MRQQRRTPVAECRPNPLGCALPVKGRTRIACLLLALLLPSPTLAWEARTGVICTLTHETDEVAVRLTYDPALPRYTITLTRLAGSWSPGPVFSIRFDGPRGLTISTTRHLLEDGGAALTVADSGFGNVLNGLEFNTTATAFTGGDSVTIPLDGAAPAVRAFRDCTVAPSV